VWSIIVAIDAVSHHALFPMERIIALRSVPNIHEGLIDELDPQFANAAGVAGDELGIFDNIAEFADGESLKLPVEF
jgi:hypothetical protein